MKIDFKLNESIKNLICFSILVLFSMIIIPIVIIRKPIVFAEDKSIINEVEDSMVKEVSELIENDEIRLNIKNEIKVYLRNKDEIVTLSIDDYIKSVISGEMPVSFELEALKAQGIAARTFAVSRIINPCIEANGADVCDSTHCQVYIEKDTRLNLWDKDKADENWSKIEMAVEATTNQVLTYKDELVKYPQFFSTSSGMTENSGDVFVSQLDYLVSVESKGEEIAPRYKENFTFSISDFIEKINTKYELSNITEKNLKDSIKVISRSKSGGIKEIKIGEEVIKGSDLRLYLGLTSTNFEFEVNENEVIFKCTGYGHGVGMSQWGANVMGKEGKMYNEILKHYYTGVDIKKISYENQ